MLRLQFPALQIHHQNRALQIWSCYHLLLLVIEGISQKAVGLLHYPRIRTDSRDSNIPLSNFQSGPVPLKLYGGRKKALRIALSQRRTHVSGLTHAVRKLIVSEKCSKRVGDLCLRAGVLRR